MSNGDLGFNPGDFPGVTESETNELAQIMGVNTQDCAPPTIKFAIPKAGLQDLFRYVCGALRELGVPRWLATLGATAALLPLFIINAFISVLITVLAPAAAAFFKEALGLIDQLRKDLDPSVASAAVLVLNELLGTEFTADHLAQGMDVASHIQRAEVVGGLLHDQLFKEFQPTSGTDAVPSATPARRLSGFLINFGTATGILGVLGGLVPEIHLNELREIGEEVARNLGLGRMHRMAMKPLITTMIATPYQWLLNQTFHPTQFKVGDVVNPFTQTLMDQGTIFKAMDLLGYSQDKITALIKLHSKRLGLAELELFDRYGVLARDATLGLMKELGYLEDTAPAVLVAEDLKRADAVLRLLVDELEARANSGDLPIDQFSSLLDSLPLGPQEKKFRLQAVMVKVKAPKAHLTLAQGQKAFEEGIWTLDQLETYLVARGYNADDVQTLELITLLALAKLAEAKTVAQFAYDKKKAAAEAKGLPVPPPPAILSS
jgi:hypothetical protein